MADFSPVAEKFNDLLEQHPSGCAAQVAVYHNGKLHLAPLLLLLKLLLSRSPFPKRSPLLRFGSCWKKEK